MRLSFFFECKVVGQRAVFFIGDLVFFTGGLQFLVDFFYLFEMRNTSMSSLLNKSSERSSSMLMIGEFVFAFLGSRAIFTIFLLFTSIWRANGWIGTDC